MQHDPLSQKARRTGPPPISWLMKARLDNPDLISLAVGFVDQDTLPTQDALACSRAILEDAPRGRAALQYGSTIGLPALRESILGRLAEEEGLSPDEHRLNPDHVVVTTGSQSLLYLVTEVLVDPGDLVIIGDPSYFVYMGILEGVGADVRGVPVDADGMNIEALGALIDRLRGEGKLERLKLIYVVSYFQNPSGVSLSAERRRALVDLVREIRVESPVFVLEDGAYRELRYAGPRVPPIKNLDRGNNLVAYAGTFCKSFSAGLKTGYGVLPDVLLEPVLNEKGNLNFGSPNFNQCLLDEAIRSGRYARHVETVRRGYEAKLRLALDALAEYMPDGVEWIEPRGGLYIWMTVPPSIDTGPEGALFKRATDLGVLYVPGAFCFYPEPGREKPRNGLRLSFGVESPDTVREGIRRLGRAVADTLA
ncbi:MAG: PLP-dependent aminotransferase family protein [Planctomycetota bacterium]